MKLLTKLSILCCGVCLLSGCAGIQGRWEATGAVRPAGAVDDFSVGSATFNDDGTYEATMTYGGQERTSTGAYTYVWNDLTLTPSNGGPVREYDVKLLWFGTQLDFEFERENQPDVHIEMKRVDPDKSSS